MKATGITRTALLSMLLGIAAPGYAQQERQGEKQDHPEGQENRHEQARPQQQHAQPKPQAPHAPPQRSERAPQPPHAQPQQQADRAQPQQQHAQPQRAPNQRSQQAYAQPERNHQPSARGAQERQRVQSSAWQQHRARSWQADHRTWQQRGGYHGYRIPEARFRGYFGPEHGFRIHGLPFLVVGGYPRFRYQGYWVSAVDPWPEYWANDWYDTDDVYVTYVDSGYYLYNRRYPDVGIAINISL